MVRGGQLLSSDPGQYYNQPQLVQLRNGFQKAFKANVPLGVFTHANQTLGELLDKLAARVA